MKKRDVHTAKTRNKMNYCSQSIMGEGLTHGYIEEISRVTLIKERQSVEVVNSFAGLRTEVHDEGGIQVGKLLLAKSEKRVGRCRPIGNSTRAVFMTLTRRRKTTFVRIHVVSIGRMW